MSEPLGVEELGMGWGSNAGGIAICREWLPGGVWHGDVPVMREGGKSRALLCDCQVWMKGCALPFWESLHGHGYAETFTAPWVVLGGHSITNVFVMILGSMLQMPQGQNTKLSSEEQG